MANLHLVTGYAGQAHVTAADDGSFNRAIFGSGQYVLDFGSKFAASVVSNNKITIADGDLLMQGRHVRLNEGTTVDLTITNGTQGKLRSDLIVARYTKDAVSGVEQVNLVVIQGTAVDSDPADPAYTSGDIINDHDLVNDMPLYRVPLDGLNVGTPVALFSLASIQISDGTVTTAKLANGAVTGDKLASGLVVPIAKGGTGNTEGIAQKIKDSVGGYPLNITWAKSAQESTDYLASWTVIDGVPEIGSIAPGKLSVNWANIADTLASTLPINKGGTGNTEGIAQKIKDSVGGYPLNITWAKSAQESTDYLASWTVIDGVPEIGSIAPGKLSVNWANIADTLASTLPINKGGTGATTRQEALKNLTPDEIKSPICVYTENGGWNGGYTYLADLAAALGVVSITKLWENASPTSSFPTQNIDLDFSDYSHVIVIAMATNSYQYQVSTFVRKAVRGMVTGCWGDENITFHRSFNTSNSTIWFDSAYYSYNDGAVSPNALIPYQIYGVKGVA